MLMLDIQETPKPGEGVRAFSAEMKNVSRRTYGKLFVRDDGTLAFAYRRLLFGPEKTAPIGRASSFSIGRGVFHPTVVEPIESAGKHRIVFRMLPTYRGTEQELLVVLGCATIEDLRWPKGLQSFWKFVTGDDSGTTRA